MEAIKPMHQAKGKLHLCNSLFISLCFLYPTCPIAGDLSNETWVVDNFTSALSGGPPTGPVIQSGNRINAICGNKSGYLFLINGQQIDIVTPDGIRYHLAGNGTRGYRDGPAYLARFNTNKRSYYGGYDLACGNNNDVFVADNGNGRIRHIFKKNDKWFVETTAGGGTNRLKPGENFDPRGIRFSGSVGIAVTSNNYLYIGDSRGYYRLNLLSKKISLLDNWLSLPSLTSKKNPRLHIMKADVDRNNNIYFVSNTPSVIIKIFSRGKASHLAGIPYSPRHWKTIGDGPAIEAYFRASSSIVADQKIPAVYISGGDEYDIRRIPTKGDGKTATLMQNGKWHHASVHPHKSRGPAIYTPGKHGKLKPEGSLTNFATSYIYGRDANGNIYCGINRWTAMTQYIKGSGLLSTRIYRIHRVME